MKFNFLNTTKSVLVVSALAFASTGCLKQYDSSARDYNNDNPSDLLEFVKIDDNHLATATTPASISLLGQPVVDTVTIGYLRVASPDLPSSSINVTLKVDNTIVPSGTTALPTGSYRLLSNLNTATGVRNNKVQIILTKSSLDPLITYSIAVTTNTIGSGKLNPLGNVLVTNISVRNQYDGIYSVVSGTVTRYTAPGSPANDALSGNLAGNPDVSLTTVGVSTVQITGLQWANKGGGVGGIDNLQATVNTTTNLVTMAALGNATLANWENMVNKYDPATQTFTLNFRWNPTANRREYSVILKYKGPR